MTLRFLSVLLAVGTMAAPVVAQEAGKSVPPPENVSETIPPVVMPSQASVAQEAPALAPAWVERWWFNGSYILDWGTPTRLPPLITTSPAGTPQASAGVLSNPKTSVITGNDNVNGDFQSGFKLGMGSWFDEYNTLGFNAGFFMLTERNDSFVSDSNGSTILARPFTNANNGKQTSLLVAFPNGSGPTGVTSSGSISVTANSGPFYSAHFDLQENIYRDPGFSLNSLLGYRYLRFDNGLQVQQTMHPSGGAFVAGTQIDSQDNFTASNTFNGLDIGLEAQWQRERWALDFLAKAALGNMNNNVGINGSTQVSVPGSPTNQFPGGLLALSTNSGSHNHYDWTAAPEFDLTLSWNVTDKVRLSLGYSLLFFFDVARASDQINLNINPNLLNPKFVASPTPGSSTSPTFDLHQSSLLLQSINVGLEYRF